MSYSLIDTHCHITSDRLYGRIEEILHNATVHHVEKMLVVCTNFDEYERAALWKHRHAPIDIAMGFHPSDLNEIKEEDYVHLEALLQAKQLVAVGEIGLDYHWGHVSKQDQKMGLARQMQLAQRYHKPVLIHMRDATKDTMEELQKYPDCIGIMHCYSGSVESAQQFLTMGYYISFAGPLTFKNARGAPDVAKAIPMDRLMVETDCPFLTPHPFRGKENEPMYIEHTFQKLCAIKQCDEEVLSKQLIANYERLFSVEDGEAVLK